MLVQNYAPNNIGARVVAEATTAWRVLGIHYTAGLPVVTGYATIVALLAAGDKMFPGLDGGAKMHSLLVETENGSGAAGSGVYVAFNHTDAAPPTADSADIPVLGGVTLTDLQARNVWISKVTAADRVFVRARF